MLDAIKRAGIGVRELLRYALGGTDPNNIIHRLVARREIVSVQRALPQNRAYYLPKGDKPLGAVALAQRLARAWFVQMPSKSTRVLLTKPELRTLFGDQAPPGAHVLQDGPADRPRVLLIYTPDTELVAEGILRVIERARTFPSVAAAMDAKDYGIAVLVPWNSGLAPKVRSAASGKPVPRLSALARAENIAKRVHLVVARAPGALDFTQALREERLRLT